jgi:hypothetical protein
VSSTGGAPAPNPACPAVYSAPVPRDAHDDNGGEGLAALRAKVLASRDKWEAYKAAHDDTYSYERRFESYFGGSCETTVQVTQGKISLAIERSQSPDYPSDGTAPYVTRNVWTPGSGEAANSCHPVVTMDALYDECLTKTLCQDPRDNWLYVNVDARGLLVRCGFFSMNCQDDCYEGIEPLLLTSDGKDWTKPLPGCCEPSPEPDCCMNYGGPSQGEGSCGMTCDAMPVPNDPGWNITFDSNGCASWRNRREEGIAPCCGCALPVDAGAADAAH